MAIYFVCGWPFNKTKESPNKLAGNIHTSDANMFFLWPQRKINFQRACKMPRKRKEYYERVSPFQRYTDEKFLQRFRLTKDVVHLLWEDFSRTPFASTKGTRRSKGLLHEERVCTLSLIRIRSPFLITKTKSPCKICALHGHQNILI